MPHINDKYDFVISVYIVYKGQVLLVNHPRYKLWVPMGGHIELDEDPEQALYREIEEETGLTGIEILSSRPSIDQRGTKFLPTPNYMDVHEANPPHKHICMVYFARAKNKNHRLSDEHIAIEWLGLEDLDKPVYSLENAVKFYCQEAIKVAQ